MGNLVLSGLGHVLNMILNLLQLIVFVSVFISLLGADPSNPIVNFVERTTEPLYRPLRQFTRNIPGPFDWAPFIVLLLIVFVQKTVVTWLLMQSAQ
jgi:YggT family protein